MAHTYATDSSERKHVPFFLAAAAIGSTFGFMRWLHGQQVELPWWSPPVDTMAFYGMFYVLFDRFIWRFPPLRWIHATKVPNLTGTWHGTIEPAPTQGVSAGLEARTAITVRIVQSWTTLLIRAETAQSKSHSITGAIVVHDEQSLSYEFLNEPTAAATATMHAHRGVARLTVKDGGTVLDGEYYSGRDRQT